MSEQADSATSDPVKETIGRVLGRVPSGVFIATAADGDGNETGMLASWVQQAGFEPPSFTVVVNKTRYLNEWLGKNPKLAVSIVGDGQFEFMKHFGKGFDPGQPAFEGIEIARGTTGMPVLTGAIGFLEGTVTAQVESGDHVIYVVEIENAGAHESLDESKPYIHTRKNGFGY